MVIARWIILIAFAASTLLIADSSSDQYKKCEQRCASLTGMYKYKCINTCVRSGGSKYNPYSSRYNRYDRYNKNRKSRYKRNNRKNNSKMNYDDCRKMCKGYSGIDSVKCIRTCMDGNTSMAKKSYDKKRVEERIMRVCAKRCRLFNGKAKYNCLTRCVNQEAKKSSGYMKNW
jgi:hypothetical protein